MKVLTAFLLQEAHAFFPLVYVYGDKSTGSPFIPVRFSMISDKPAKLLHSVIFQSGICLDYIHKM